MTKESSTDDFGVKIKVEEPSAPESTKDFKKRAEELEAAHLFKVKSTIADDAPNFSVSQVISSM